MVNYAIIKHIVLIVVVICFSGCASIKLGSVPPPPDTGQLRVALYAVTGIVKQGKWGSTPEEYRKWHYGTMSRVLRNFGAYQVVPDSEVRAVLGGVDPTSWQLSRNRWELAFDLGKALHADYVLVSERGTLGDPDYFYEATLLNVATGAKYGVRINNRREQRPDSPRLPQGTPRLAYGELFKDAKADLLSTALRKSRQVSMHAAVDHTVEAQRLQEEESARRELDRARVAAEKRFALAPRQVPYREAHGKEEVTNGRRKLIVYDITSPESLNVPALILSEALREEILKRGDFNLVNRENLAQIVEELKFQQSGLVDPAQAVRLGRGAGASEVVTGNMGAIGQILILQSKRIQVETMQNISAASLKGQPGQEDELLERLPGLVDRLFSGK